MKNMVVVTLLPWEDYLWFFIEESWLNAPLLLYRTEACVFFYWIIAEKDLSKKSQSRKHKGKQVWRKSESIWLAAGIQKIGIRNPDNWKPESKGLESGIQYLCGFCYMGRKLSRFVCLRLWRIVSIRVDSSKAVTNRLSSVDPTYRKSIGRVAMVDESTESSVLHRTD